MTASTTQPRRSSADSRPRTYRTLQDSAQRQNSASELAERWSSRVPSRRWGRRTGASSRGDAVEVIMCAPCRGAAVAEIGSGVALLKQRAHVVRVLVDDPGNKIGNALPWWMRNHPELEVLRAVVEADSVLVVHKLMRRELSTEYGLHDDLVLAHAASSRGDVEGPVAVGVDRPGAVGSMKGRGVARVAIGEVAAPVHVAHALAAERGSPAAADHADISGGEGLFVVTLAEAARTDPTHAPGDRAA